jgi:hypothetical protein
MPVQTQPNEVIVITGALTAGAVMSVAVVAAIIWAV